MHTYICTDTGADGNLFSLDIINASQKYNTTTETERNATNTHTRNHSHTRHHNNNNNHTNNNNNTHSHTGSSANILGKHETNEHLYKGDPDLVLVRIREYERAQKEAKSHHEEMRRLQTAHEVCCSL